MLKSVELSSSYKNEPNRAGISFFSYPLLFLIKIYRVTLSPFIGNSCRFHPTCSHYSEDALKKYGPIRGVWLTIKRIFRCHPWNDGGYDPVQ